MIIPPHYTHIKYDSIDSTNLEAKRLIQGGEVLGDCIISAKTQSRGRGRLERNWVSCEGNLFVSIVKEVGESDNRINEQNSPLSLIPFIAALAVGDTLQKFIEAEKISYKWPNDVLVRGKKISGILIEIVRNYTIIGIGINICNYPESGTKIPATCLNEYTKKNVLVDEVLESLLHNLDKIYALGKAEIIHEWLSCAYKVNESVTIIQENKEISGIYRGIDENGRLILETNESKRELVLFGDVVWD
jgi:BirA family biotin operon repressor/biotin-[acetyl-CoA-carboxylase] ligase